MAIEVKLFCSIKAPGAMEVTELGITVFWQPATKLLSVVFIIALQLSLLSYTGLFASTVIEFKLLQPKKGFDSVVTELGMLTEVRLLQPLNAE